MTRLRALLPEISFSAIYLLLEWMEHLRDSGLHGALPWDPSTGMGFAVLLLGGWRYVPLAAACEIIGTMLFCSGSPSLTEVVAGAVYMILVWGASAWFLRSRIDVRLGTQRDLLILVAVACVASAAHGAGEAAENLLGGGGGHEVATELVRAWIGDMIGVTVVTPAMLVLRGARRLPPRMLILEVLAQTVVAAIVLAANFTRLSSGGLQLFF